MEAGKELDALVAENVMGLDRMQEHHWKRAYGYEKRRGETLFQQGHATVNSVRVYTGQKGRFGGVMFCAPPRNYSTDIAVAWEVVERVNPEDEEFRLSRFKRQEWECTFAALYFTGMPAQGKTPPHAICLAALKAVGWEEPKK